MDAGDEEGGGRLVHKGVVRVGMENEGRDEMEDDRDGRKMGKGWEINAQDRITEGRQRRAKDEQ